MATSNSKVTSHVSEFEGPGIPTNILVGLANWCSGYLGVRLYPNCNQVGNHLLIQYLHLIEKDAQTHHTTRKQAFEQKEGAQTIIQDVSNLRVSPKNEWSRQTLPKKRQPPASPRRHTWSGRSHPHRARAVDVAPSGPTERTWVRPSKPPKLAFFIGVTLGLGFERKLKQNIPKRICFCKSELAPLVWGLKGNPSLNKHPNEG